MTEITTFNVPKVACGDSAEAIAGAVRPMAGVSDVVVNIPARLVQVEYDDSLITPKAIKDAIESSGYLVQRYSDGRR